MRYALCDFSDNLNKRLALRRQWAARVTQNASRRTKVRLCGILLHHIFAALGFASQTLIRAAKTSPT